MKKVVIYPGRFQPMLPHHAEVYKKLQATFPDADVYIATSDKVDGGKSPFNFKEKAEIMAQLHDIPTDKILIAPQPYLIDSYKNFNKQDTMVIFAVGEKDTDRFPMKNIDDNTGLDMTVRGEPRPKYYQMINTLKQHPALPMEERGYIYVAPNIEGKGVVASASAFRQAFTSVGSEQGQREVFEKYLGTFNEAIFALFKNKILGDNMKEELDRIKKLAGLESLIEAPINFDDQDDMEDGDDYENKPGFSQDNMINQLGKVIDSETAGKDAEAMKIKNFKPVTNVTTDDGETIDVTPAEAKALKDMFGMLSSARQGEEKSARERFNATIQTTKGLEQMLDFAKSKGLVKEESNMPQLDLADIRSDYTVEEGDLEEGKMKDIIIDAQQMSKEEFDAQYKGEFDYDEIIADYPVEESTPEESFDPAMEPSHADSEFERIYTAYENGGEPELAEYLGMSDSELDQEMTEYAMDHNLHMDDDRDDVIQGYIEQLIDNADHKDMGAQMAQYESQLVQLKKLAGIV
tara:strand:+ start:527 stop:2083 length:1557 start_codon:yes stop_codon:yes gene_type:complete